MLPNVKGLAGGTEKKNQKKTAQNKIKKKKKIRQATRTYQLK